MESDGSTWVGALVAVAIVSGISLVGAASLVVREKLLRNILIVLVAFAAGALLGDAFLHLLPETVEVKGEFGVSTSFAVLAGVSSFFVLEKGLHWHHSHIGHDETVHPVAVTNLMGDGLHNFLDGAIIASSFAASPELGIATAIAVALHEIPQELGDFGILVHSGLKPRKALALNFATGLAAVAGAVATLAFAPVEAIEQAMVPFTAGAFIYIASTDLMPEIHKEPEPLKSVIQLLAFGCGVGIMAGLLVLE
jgi:zinc and cadmium transporter